MNKNIIFFVDSMYNGGAQRVIAVLAKKLIERGFSVDIVMLTKRPIAFELHEDINIIYAEDLPVSRIFGGIIRRVFHQYVFLRRRFWVPFLRRIKLANGYPKWNETSFFFYANYAIPYREFLKKREGSIAFGFLIRSNIALGIASKRLKVKTIFCERNNPIRPDMPKNIMKLRDKYYPRFDAGVFQTPDEMAYYTKLKGPKKVIPNPVKENLPERFTGIRRHEIVNFCRLSKQKRLPILIDAFKLLLADYPDYILRIYGNGEEEESLKQYIKEQGLEGKAIIEEFVSDIHEKIVDAAMFVSTSDFEGLSNSMIEAMAIGLPCICTDCDGGGARMMIKDHWNGLLVDKGDTKAVYEAMVEILKNQEWAETLSQNAYQTRCDLDVSKIVDEWISMIF